MHRLIVFYILLHSLMSNIFSCSIIGKIAEFCLPDEKRKIIYTEVNPFICKMAKHTLKDLRCEHRKIFKVCLAILQHYA